MIASTALSPATPRTAARRLRPVNLMGPAGKLEAVLNEGAPEAKFAALVCHPHPLGGGTLHNKVVYHAMKALNGPEFGLEWPVLRFNFRGVGLSHGEHDGLDETADVRAALNWIENAYKLPIVLVGFSFGAVMAMRACFGAGHPVGSRVRALAALGLPVRVGDREYQYDFPHGCSLPKLFLSGDRDAFAPRDELAAIVAKFPEPKTLVLVPGADHFFANRLELMRQQLGGWIKEQLA